MKRKFVFLLWLIGLFQLASPIRAYSDVRTGIMKFSQNDSIQLSLLTCAPGNEIYALFGHTAIRYQNFSQGVDWVFNYGMFSFNTPNFIYRFVKGETDYQLGITPFPYFEAEYALRGSSVYQQVLNLTPLEKQTLLRLLRDNYLPENRIYRYNYFYDNCTTRARDQIEKSIQGKVVYPSVSWTKTFRGIVHEFTVNSPWDELGIDLCLGAEADKAIDARKQMFAPFYMRYFADGAYIQDKDGNTRPFILREEKIVDVSPEIEPPFALTPMGAGALFLFLNVLVAFWQWRKKCIFWGWDVVLYAAQGIAGCIIAFLFFVSSHPTVGSNWLLILFNPIPLFYLPFMVYRDIKRKKDLYHLINLVYLTLFMLLFLPLPQKFNLTVLPLALGLLVNAASHVLVLNKRQ
ncbi:DUF4105 domain-containing protein [uncultured Bacteroides sp.]|uniref:lipoprotein N-acyltransferase Lnb n=1 Tax=uncultured Bacteroides sp. TaxID=162156 RepID=UPI00280C0433|nr:DUF4105 domain-containing protein [uncultured Bacteroides sp.]